EFPKDRRLVHPGSNEDGNSDQENGEQEWDTPAPVIEALSAQPVLYDQNHGKRDEQAENASLNETGVEASLMIGDMLGHVDGRAAIFTADRNALQHSQGDQSNRREPSGGRVGWQQADRRRCSAHDNQRHQKGILAANQIAHATEEQCAERPDDQAYSEGRQVGQVSKRGVSRRGELQRQPGGGGAHYEKIEPLDS